MKVCVPTSLPWHYDDGRDIRRHRVEEFYPDDAGIPSLRNVDTHLSDYTGTQNSKT
jgi:hypothetical protein